MAQEWLLSTLLVLWSLQGFYGWLNLWLYRIRMRLQDERLNQPLETPPLPAILMAPMKGIRHNFETYVGGLLNQDYPDYHLVFTVESTDDPLYSKLRDRLGLTDEKLAWPPPTEPPPNGSSTEVSPGLRRIRLIVVGLCTEGAQKVHNQLRALQELRDEDRLIAASDADINPTPDMLTRLLGPLNQGTHVASTGYRWLIPLHRHLGMWTASVVNSSVATMGGPEWCNLMWGGAHALTRKAHEEIGLTEKFKGAFNDDLQTAYHVRREGKKIAYLRSLMLPSPEKYDWPTMFGFGWRQYFHVRIYAPSAWWSALLITALYLSGSVAAWGSLIAGNLKVLLPICIVFLFNQLRASERIALQKTLFSEEDLDRLAPTFFLEKIGTFFCMAVHFLMVCRSRIGNKVTWSGVTYKVTGRQQATVVARPDRL